jgi:hypothetical protein
MTRQVRVSINPDRLIEVDDAEYADLKAQNLIVDDVDTPNEDNAPKAQTQNEGHDALRTTGDK